MTTHRERVLDTFRFHLTDRPPYDLMEGCVWTELLEYFKSTRGLQDPNAVFDYLDTDFRWTFLNYTGPAAPPVPIDEIPVKGQSKGVLTGPLAHATTVSEVEAHPWPNPGWWVPGDYAALKRDYPDYARVLCVGWMPLFWGACEAFGMDEALVKMKQEPKVFDAFIQKQQAFYIDILERCALAAEGNCDLCWLGDDYAAQTSLLMNPELWRRQIKPYLAQQVDVAHRHGMRVLFHSCGSVRAILPDMIDIGVDALLVYQTTARGMDPVSIARDFGKKMVFYGGVDVQHLLSFGTPEDVRAEVTANLRAFEDCGGYIVANSHHTLTSIQGANIEAMCHAARDYRYQHANR